MKDNFLKQAKYYHSLGLNTVCISSEKNIFNFDDNNLLKAPNHDQNLYKCERQTLDNLMGLDWNRASGVGITLGYDDTYAIDIDGCTEFKIVQDICKVLNLPINYDWIIKSGSHEGYHILFRCKNTRKISNNSDKIFKLRHSSQRDEPFPNDETNAYYPTFDNRAFYKIEFKWSGNLVLPDSLHVSGKCYEFIAHRPIKQPAFVDFYRLLAVKNIYSSIQAERSEYSTRQFIARKDEESLNYSTRKIEPYILIKSDLIRINNNDLANPQADIVVIQINWLVLDKNFNVLKRKSYNYFRKTNALSNSKFFISLDKAHCITSNRRSVLLEFLFDLGHVKRIISENASAIEFIKNELLTSGLYLDNFCTKYTQTIQEIPDISEYPGPEKEQIFFEDNLCDRNLSVGELYRKFLLSQGVSEIFTELTDSKIESCLLEAQEIISDSIESPAPNNPSSHSEYLEDRDEEEEGRYSGSYAQEQEGYSDQDIDDIFDGDPDNYWNID